MTLETNYEETEITNENVQVTNDAADASQAEAFPPKIEEQNVTKNTVEYSADGSPVLIRLTPEQQQWFADFSERMGKEVDELNEFIQEQREHHAVHTAPIYDGLGPTEDMYRYDAEKEYEANGDSARYRELLELAEDAKLRRVLGHW